jgi:hypothetical protein
MKGIPEFVAHPGVRTTLADPGFLNGQLPRYSGSGILMWPTEQAISYLDVDASYYNAVR